MRIVVPEALDLRKLALGDPITQAMPLRNGDHVALPEQLSYVFIIFTCRTGSFYLADLLSTSGYFNKGDEDLSPGAVARFCAHNNIDSFSEYFATIAASKAQNGCFVVKSSIEQLVTLAWHGVLQRIARRSRFIVMERMDKAAQVVSWSIAIRSGRFLSAEAPTPADLVYDGAEMRNLLQWVAFQNAQIALFLGLNGLVPLQVTYEQLIAAPLACSRTVCKFLGHREVVCDPTQVRLIRQATPLNRAWRARFLAEQAAGADAL